MLRIGTQAAYRRSLTEISQRSVQLDEQQLKLSSGLKINKPSDDPAEASRAERANSQIRSLDFAMRGLTTSQAATGLIEGSLGDAGSVLQHIRETIVAAGNGGYGPEQRKALADTLQQARDQLLTIANRQDGGGLYVFAGQSSAVVPFQDTATGVQFNGIAGEQYVNGGDPLPTTFDGEAIFMKVPSGNGTFEINPDLAAFTGSVWSTPGQVTDPTLVTGHNYTLVFGQDPVTLKPTYTINDVTLGTQVALDVPYKEGTSVAFDGISFTLTGTPKVGDTMKIDPSTSQSMFKMLDDAIAGIRGGTGPLPNLQQVISTALNATDKSLGLVQDARAKAGEVLNRMDMLQQRLVDAQNAAKGEKSSAEDLDLPSAISEFTNLQTGYDAALRAYAQVRQLSLFSYIS